MLQPGWTALMIAVIFGHTATAVELVRLGADINAKNCVRAREGAELGATHRG
jgi:ankyrin repeat protein